MSETEATKMRDENGSTDAAHDDVDPQVHAATSDTSHGNGEATGTEEATPPLADPADDTPPPIVHLDHVSRWYGDVIGVNDLSADLPPGITGLLGPNGAGKSTLIKMLVGLLRPSSGRLHVLGQDPWGNPKVIGRIGYVPEAPAPWRDHAGLDAVTRGARLSGLPEDKAEDAARAALARVGLEEAAAKQVGAYSHGMQQRLKFALAIVHDPDLLVLDEPLLGTDPMARRDLLDLIRSLAADGKSILVSTHVLPDIEALTDRILVMNHGRLMAHGGVAEIRDLLERYPRTVRIGTTDPRGLGQRIWQWPSVLSLEAGQESLTVHTKDPSAFYESLQELLIDGTLPFASVTSPDDNVEAVFRYLVG